MKYAFVLVVFLSSIFNSVFGQTILFPPAKTVLYTGDKIPICWKANGLGNSVWIHLYSPDWRSGKTIFIALAAPDNGEFEWTVDKGLLTETNLVLTVFYSGVANVSPVSDEIPVVVLSGPRPKDVPLPTIEPVSIPVSIRKVVSIEWSAKTNHVYKIESSIDLKNWQIEAEGQPTTTNVVLLFYQDQVTFFKVEDTTPLRP